MKQNHAREGNRNQLIDAIDAPAVAQRTVVAKVPPLTRSLAKGRKRPLAKRPPGGRHNLRYLHFVQDSGSPPHTIGIAD